MASISNHVNVISTDELIARVAHLSKLRQPGAVDLGRDDNECDQDSLFRELSSLENVLDQCGDREGRLMRRTYFDAVALEQDVRLDADGIRKAYIAVDFDGVEYLLPRT